MLASLICFGVAGGLASTLFPARVYGARYTRNGGIRFVRIGRLQLSFCVCRGARS